MQEANDFHTLLLYEGDNLKEKILLKKEIKLSIGRSSDCQIVLSHPSISRNHALIVLKDNKIYALDNDSTNGTFINNTHIPVNEYIQVLNKQSITFPKANYSLQVHYPLTSLETEKLIVGSDSEDLNIATMIQSLNKTNAVLTIGRSSHNDIQIPSLRVSKTHARIFNKNGKIYIEDCNSLNGTFVNNNLIDRPTPLQGNSIIQIGLTNIEISKGTIIDLPKKEENAIIVSNVEKRYSNGFIGLQNLSLKIKQKSFVALMGPSGCGKSTFLKGMNGANPFSSGKVMIHGLDLNKYYPQLSRNIGYVPQDDIIHKELTVEQTLFFAAKLRMPNDISKNEISSKISDVLSSLNINTKEIRETPVGKLSGGQRKRISIAVELLNDPSILFLDEPTSPLDPETIGDFLTCIKELSNKGVTTVMVTHKPSDLNYVDQVIFLSAGGFLSYYGKKEGLLNHFNARSLIEVYSLLKNKKNGQEWGLKWNRANAISTIKPKITPIQTGKKESFFNQLYWLTKRYFNIKWSDKYNISLLVAQPIIIAILISFIFDAGLEIGVIFLIAISAVWFGVSNSAKEIVSEQAIYRRERMFNLRLNTYVLSKLFVLSLVAIVQTALFIGVIFIAYSYFNVPEEFTSIKPKGFIEYTLFTFYLSVSASLLGLVLSAIFSTTEKVMTVVPIMLIPQIMLAGIVAKIDNSLKEILSFLTLGRWGTEGLSKIQDNNSIKNDSTDLFTRIDSTEVEKSILSPEPIFEDSTIYILEGRDSITIQKPVGGTNYSPDEAMRVLDFYNENVSGIIVNGGGNYIIAITLLNIILYVLLIIILKRKDSI